MAMKKSSTAGKKKAAAGAVKAKKRSAARKTSTVRKSVRKTGATRKMAATSKAGAPRKGVTAARATKKKTTVRTRRAGPREAMIASNTTESLSVGSVVRLRDAGDSGELGRICKITVVGCCVQFAETGCLPVPLSALVPATGSAPSCTTACSEGC